MLHLHLARSMPSTNGNMLSGVFCKQSEIVQIVLLNEISILRE